MDLPDFLALLYQLHPDRCCYCYPWCFQSTPRYQMSTQDQQHSVEYHFYLDHRLCLQAMSAQPDRARAVLLLYARLGLCISADCCGHMNNGCTIADQLDPKQSYPAE